MDTTIKNIRDWSIAFKQHVSDKPAIPSLDIRKLRAKLLLEECLELIIEGLGIELIVDKSNDVSCDLRDLKKSLKTDDLEINNEGNLTHIIDGYGDLLWVTIGTALSCGFADKTQEIMDEIARSNNSKLWTFEDIISKAEGLIDYAITCCYCGAKHGTCRCDKFHINRRWLVTNTSGKCIKSPSYSPVNFESIINPEPPLAPLGKIDWTKEDLACLSRRGDNDAVHRETGEEFKVYFISIPRGIYQVQNVDKKFMLSPRYTCRKNHLLEHGNNHCPYCGDYVGE